MKTIITTITGSLIIGACIAVIIFMYQSPTTTDVALLNDITDKQLASIDTGEILSLYDLTGSNKWNGATFIFSNVTDVSYNQTQNVALESANNWLSNELERNKEVNAFMTKVSDIVNRASSETTGKMHSSVYFPVAHQLVALSQSNAQKRILIVSSDLMENTPSLSFYNKDTFRLLQSNPNAIQALLTALQTLPNLNGITVYLIFQPANPAADEQYKEVSTFYQNFLQSKGATVFIGANLPQ